MSTKKKQDQVPEQFSYWSVLNEFANDYDDNVWVSQFAARAQRALQLSFWDYLSKQALVTICMYLQLYYIFIFIFMYFIFILNIYEKTNL